MDRFDNQVRSQFESLVVEYHVRVRGLVRSLGVDPNWVDDIAQEAFIFTLWLDDDRLVVFNH